MYFLQVKVPVHCGHGQSEGVGCGVRCGDGGQHRDEFERDTGHDYR